jgi:hypothetical protein
MPGIEGGCFCGEIRYRASGRPTNSMVCHCRSCRRISGSPVVAWLTFPVARLQFIRGKPARFQSSRPVRRTFCGSCGTPLTYAHSNSPRFVDVTTASLDNPTRYPPTHHSWLSHDLAWLRFGDGLPAYQQARPGS